MIDAEEQPPADMAASHHERDKDGSYEHFLEVLKTPSKDTLSPPSTPSRSAPEQAADTTSSAADPTPNPEEAPDAANAVVAAPIYTDIEEDTMDDSNSAPIKDVNIKMNTTEAETSSDNDESDYEEKNQCLQFLSVLLFVIGSVLYLVMAVEDLHWARRLQTLPMWLRYVDDDLSWVNYNMFGRNSAIPSSSAGGVRRRLMREFWASMEEEDGEEEDLAQELHTSNVVSMNTTISTNSMELPRTSRALQTPSEMYYDEDWADLSQEVQDAYEILGYNEQLWDEGGIAFSDDYDWIELTPEMLEAAVLLGYTEEFWCRDELGGEWTCDIWPSSTPSESPSGTPTLTPTTSAPTSKPTFKPTTVSPTSRPTSKPVTKSPTPVPTPKPVTKTSQPTKLVFNFHLEWDDLDENTQTIYKLLGYDKDLWNSGGSLPIDNLSWSEMSLGGRFSLMSLGITQASWDAAEPGNHFPLQPLPGKVPIVSVVQWTDVESGYRANLQILGFNESMWNSGTKLPIDYLSWNEMSLEERFALTSIGIGQEEWDAAEPGNHFPLQPVASTDIVDAVTSSPTRRPTPKPSLSPSKAPSQRPTTAAPTTSAPTTSEPTTSAPTTKQPSVAPSNKPTTASPTSSSPTNAPIPFISQSPTPPLTPDELYNDEWFRDLPAEIRDAFTVLGWNETMWDAGNPELAPETEDMAWDELSPEQQAAATVIGYSAAMWDLDVVPTIAPVQPPSLAFGDPPVPVPDLLPPLPDVVYNDEYWKDLPPEIQDAYTVLGWDETSWNSGLNFPATENMTWIELSPEQQSAAATIGYNEETWDADPAEAPFTNGTSTATENITAGYYDDYDWAELPPDVQKAATVLGYDQQLWDSGGFAWSDDYFWDELPPEAQEAAAVLGYDKASWDGSESALDSYESVDDDYVFQVGETDIWVSRYQILYFFAALSFVFVGLFDLISERYPFHLLMILAGIFGVVSAIYVEEDIHASNVWNCVSVHFFLLEALTLFGQHKRSVSTSRSRKWVKRSVMIGDLSFILGALLDVILSYFYLFDDTADWDIALAGVYIFASVMWLLCALIYLFHYLLWWWSRNK